ncbi:MAG: hypothetical protein K0S27_1693, partial [Gammaproteobacteria bacterium]|nr:hypothetical protein [Gammaproteobacteria bacterium]
MKGVLHLDGQCADTEDEIKNILIKKCQKHLLIIVLELKFFRSSTMANTRMDSPVLLSESTLEALLRAFYQRQSQLENVLTDVPLSLDEDHYVQLALVKDEEHKEEEESALSKSAYRKERIDSYERIHGIKTLMKLEELFQRTSEDKKDPKKLLILGRPGIGKTVLCQYIAYRWSKGTLWNNQFDAVFWVPLRKLPSYTEEDTKRETILLWLMQQCWHADQELELDKQSISAYLKEHKGRLLFLLDGYDEVAHLKGEKTKAGKVLDFFLHQEYTILTSRPNYIDTLLRGTEKKIDRCVENIGFTNTHIEQYVRHFCVSHGATAKQEKALLAYLKQNPSIFGVAHIPIHLSLICSVWYKSSQKGQVNIVALKTMTGLYDRMIDALLDRYLEKMFSREELSRLSNATKKEKKENVVRFLSRLGFVMMQTSTRKIIISAEIFNAVFDEIFEKGSIDLPRDDFFAAIHRAGFLTPVSNHQHHQQNNKDCYFLHLTFQEYFTAKYLTEVFARGLEGAAEEAITCLKQHKFDPTYEVVWWFTAGLIQKKPDSSARELFWQKMSEPPRDLTIIRELAFFSRLLAESEEGNQEEANLTVFSLGSQALRSAQAGELSKKDVWFEIVSQYLMQTMAQSETFLSKIEKDIIHSAPKSVINQLFSSCFEKIEDGDIEEASKAVSVLKNILFRASEEQIDRVISMCKEVASGNRATALKEKIIHMLPELLQCKSQDNLDEILWVGITTLNDIRIHQNLQGTMINIFLRLDRKKITEKIADQLGLWCIAKLSQLEELNNRPYIFDDESRKVNRLFKKYFFCMSRKQQHHIIENFRIQLYDLNVDEKAKENISDFLQQIFPMLDETQQQEMIAVPLALAREAGIDHLAKSRALGLLRIFFKHLNEAQRQEVLITALAFVRGAGIESEVKRGALDLLSGFSEHLNEAQRQEAITAAWALVREAGIDRWGKTRALHLLKAFSQHLNEVQRQEIITFVFALMRGAGIESEVKRGALDLVRAFSPHLNEAQRQKVITVVFALVGEAGIEDWVKSRALDLLSGFSEHLNEAQRQEIITFVFALMRGAGIDRWRKTSAFHLLSGFSEHLNEAQRQEVLTTALAFVRGAGIDRWGKTRA